MSKSLVYFSKNIDRENLIKIYEALGRQLQSKVAVKISSGEMGGHHYLDPNLIAPLVTQLKGTLVECNTAYPGKRHSSRKRTAVCCQRRGKRGHQRN